MNFNRDELIIYLLEWEGTPYKHAGRRKGLRGDCIAPLIDALVVLGVDTLENINKVAGVYSPVPSVARLDSFLNTYLNEIDKNEALPGDWFRIAWKNYPFHMGLYTSDGENKMMLHVPEETMVIQNTAIDSELWGKIHSCYRFK